MSGEAGFNLFSGSGAIEFAVRARESSPTAVDVFVEGDLVERVVLETTEHWFRHPWPAMRLAYVELRASDSQNGNPARLLVVVPGS
jgi:hypothetical protein